MRGAVVWFRNKGRGATFHSTLACVDTSISLSLERVVRQLVTQVSLLAGAEGCSGRRIRVILGRDKELASSCAGGIVHGLVVRFKLIDMYILNGEHNLVRTYLGII